jgi:hypothetical protein
MQTIKPNNGSRRAAIGVFTLLGYREVCVGVPAAAKGVTLLPFISHDRAMPL